MVLLDIPRSITSAVLHPSDFFREEPRLDRALWALGSVLLLLSVLLVLIGAANRGTLVLTMENLEPDASGWQRMAADWLRGIMFVPMWALGLAFMTGTRFGLARALHESHLTLSGIASVTALTALPLIVASAKVGILSLCLPALTAYTQNPMWDSIVLWATLILLGAGFLIEGFLCTRALVAQLRQNNGRAVLTWLSPYLLLSFLASGWLYCGSVWSD